ncbi:hypothetical protein VOLCADRAFT_90731 [Volvox carteri f. nagariensis]|uniref:Tubby C-terminal domain-containing protein n=1 Tax=Volvox carteri f. nagariensis TaxID=3068 RepID=D8TVK7_VOLCA|nr:uncharacterized protein VOLCADRAFT_90731 [Volvox carteri f. nagariensis]EFJ48473.1 hypothetical protein VOLCADRAFT_90731 [Volvox carteri f. nagariensis]|eukprot:XP_002950272.1 hypothetical protein VOLCADRAFT_90731 [Volvox carteri f. nagariensis]
MKRRWKAGPKTHDEGDIAMRELGATGVFQNAVFQETSAEVVLAARNKIRIKKDVPSSSGKESSSTSEPLLKVPKQITEVEEIAAAVTEPKEETTPAEGDGVVHDNGSGAEISVAASPWVQPVSPAARGCKPSAVRLWEEEVKRLLAAGRAEDALQWAAPSDGMIRCTMRRVKNFMGQTLAYHLFLDNGDTFVLAARKRKKSTNSNYVLSTSQADLGRDSEHRIAKLRANFVGTEYSLMSRGCSAAAAASGSVACRQGSGSGAAHLTNEGASGGAAVRPVSPAEETSAGTAEQGNPSASASSRQHQQPDSFGLEEMAVHFKQTVLTTKGGPRTMLIATPLPDANWTPSAPDGSDSLASCLEAARRRELSPRLERHLCMLATRPPEWDSTLKAYTLDFHGRVRASSVKNFQLVHWDHNTDRKGSDLVLQFGKVEEGSEDFALDFAYPLTLQKAFGIALASTDAKLCYAL